MKAIISFLLSVMLYISSFAQFGIQESLFLEQLKEQELVSIIVKGDIEKIKETCISMNVNLKYAYQDLAAIQIEKEKLGAFYESMGQGKIEIPLGKAATLMDTALIHNNISQVHNGLSPLLQAYTGKGVVVGILDSGIYFEHDDFKNADGTTRIRYIWDQNENTPSNPPAPYNFGQEWTWQDINNGACNHVEPANQYGHGTTVAGAACGNGLATGTNTGVAPDCDIIAVAVDYYDNNFLSNTVDAVDYVFKKADALGKPCVINTSYGSYYGSHDAKDFASQLIDALIEERAGRVLVASCGNGNNIDNTNSSFKETHLSYPLSSDTNFTWFETMTNGTLYFDLWADTSDFKQAHFSIGNNNDTNFVDNGNLDFMTVNSFLGNLSQGVYLTDFVYNDQADEQGKVEMYLEETEGRYHLEFLITPSRTQDNWRLMLTGSGNFDLWSSRAYQGTADMINSGLPPNFVLPEIDFYKLPDNQKCIVSNWQCSDKVISVGNFANRSAYFDVDSVYRDLNLTPGEIYYKSSEGPTRDNRMKPDISATGNIIFASGNLDFIASALAINRPKVAPGSMHNYNGGTSMSSPIVAGAVALYLEANPTAWWYEVEAALKQTALRDTFTGPIENNVYGYGKLNAFELLKYQAILGCTDDTMFNYNANANVNDGTCLPFIYGCTDTFSLNFNLLANTDDGTCIPIVYGCMDTLALNYNPSANTDDGSCEYPIDTVSIKDIQENNLFNIHPNPSQGKLIIEVNPDRLAKVLSAKILDLNGRLIKEYDIKSSKQSLNINALSAGVYIVGLIENGTMIDQQKLIKE